MLPLAAAVSLLLIAQVVVATLQQYSLVITSQIFAADGVPRLMRFANGMLPGPTLTGTVGDTFSITVINQMTEPTALHWHGLYQLNTPHMDGAGGVTQCSIEPNSSFTYVFTVPNQWGTFWWHAHAGSQYIDGLWGPLIIYNKPEVFASNYTDEIIVSLQEYYHNDTVELLEWFLGPENSEGVEPVPDSAIMNGVGQFNCTLAQQMGFSCTPRTIPYSLFRFVPGKKYRIRIINGAAFAAFLFSIDGHQMTVIEADGVDVVPVVVDILAINVAQRYSVIVEANQAPGNYWIRGNMENSCFADDSIHSSVLGVVHYTPFWDGNLPTSQAVADSIQDAATFDPSYLSPYAAQAAPSPVGIEVMLEVSSNAAYSDDGSLLGNRFFMNGISWQMPSPPIQLSVFQGQTEFPTSANVVTIDTPMVAQVVINNYDSGEHPMHLHCVTVSVLGAAANDTWTGRPDQLAMLNLENPMRRDIFTLPGNGWAVVRFYNSAPGIWLFHCHIEWHMQAGFAMVFNVLPTQGQQLHIRSSELNCPDPSKGKTMDCPGCMFFSTIDGSGNNEQDPLLGAANTTMMYLTGTAYENGGASPAGTNTRPEPCDVVLPMFATKPFPFNSANINALTNSWARFIAADLSFTAADPAQLLPLTCYESPSCLANTSHPFYRAVVNNSETVLTPINLQTSWLDASALYGASESITSTLRSFSQGKLSLTFQASLLGIDTSQGSIASSVLLPFSAQASAQLVGNEQLVSDPALQAVLALLAMEHNLICDELLADNPTWLDERLFWEARQRVIAKVQSITFNEFLPLVLGTTLPPYVGYRPWVSPQIDVFFSAAAMRYAHSGVNSIIERIDPATNCSVDLGPVLLRDEFKCSQAFTYGLDPVLLGLMTQREQNIDCKYIDDLRRYFPYLQYDNDLALLDIMRGRDLGLPDYNTCRVAFGLSPASFLGTISSEASVVSSLGAIYNDVSHIDPIVGGLAEDHVDPGILGPLFSASITDQFIRVRDGDRWWYENIFSPTEVSTLQQFNLAALLRRNTQIDTSDPGFMVHSVTCVEPTSSSSSGSTSPSGPSNTSDVSWVSLSNQMSLSWQVNSDSTGITIYLRSTAGGWMGFGLGSSMSDADIIYGWVTTSGSVTLVDATSTGEQQPTPDTSLGGKNDAQIVSGSNDGTTATLVFYRLLNTGDSLDKAIDVTTATDIIWAFGTSNTFAQHSSSDCGSDSVTFASSPGNTSSIDTVSPPSPYLLHGISMFLSWCVCVPFGIFLVRYFKSYPFWLVTHKGFMVIVTFVTVPMASVALDTSGNSAATTHGFIGVIIGFSVVSLYLVGQTAKYQMKRGESPLLAKISRLFHKWSGRLLSPLAYFNCYLGISMLDPTKITEYWVWTAFLGVLLILLEIWYRFFPNIDPCNLAGGCRRPQQAIPDEEIGMNTFTMEQVIQQASRGQLWIVLDGEVYDFTHFLPSHPGGQVIKEFAGKDATKAFLGVEGSKDGLKHTHSSRARLKIKSYHKGTIFIPANSRISDDSDSKKSSKKESETQKSHPGSRSPTKLESLTLPDESSRVKLRMSSPSARQLTERESPVICVSSACAGERVVKSYRRSPPSPKSSPSSRFASIPLLSLGNHSPPKETPSISPLSPPPPSSPSPRATLSLVSPNKVQAETSFAFGSARAITNIESKSFVLPDIVLPLHDVDVPFDSVEDSAFLCFHKAAPQRLTDSDEPVMLLRLLHDDSLPVSEELQPMLLQFQTLRARFPSEGLSWYVKVRLSPSLDSCARYYTLLLSHPKTSSNPELCSNDTDNHSLALCIKRYQEGELSAPICDAAEGTEIFIDTLQPSFFLSDLRPKTYAFAGGTGLLPFIDVIEAWVEQPTSVAPLQSLVVVLCVKTSNDIIFAEWLRTQQRKAAGRLAIIYYLSRQSQTDLLSDDTCVSPAEPASDGKQDVRFGYIQSSDFRDILSLSDADDDESDQGKHVLICGPPMFEESIRKLCEEALVSHRALQL